MRLAFSKHVLAGPPAPQRLQPVTPTAGLDERVVGLVIGLVIAACTGLIAASPGIVATLSTEPARVATLLALTLALQMFSVQVYGRGSVSVSAIGIVASAILFDTGTAMAIAVLAAVAQGLRRRTELYKGVFDADSALMATIKLRNILSASSEPLSAKDHYEREKARRAQDTSVDNEAMASARREYRAMLEASAGSRPGKCSRSGMPSLA